MAAKRIPKLTKSSGDSALFAGAKIAKWAFVSRDKRAKRCFARGVNFAGAYVLTGAKKSPPFVTEECGTVYDLVRAGAASGFSIPQYLPTFPAEISWLKTLNMDTRQTTLRECVISFWRRVRIL